MPQEPKTLCAVGLGGMLGIQDNTNMIPERGPQTVVLSNLSWLGFLVFIADSSFLLLPPPSFCYLHLTTSLETLKQGQKRTCM